MKLKTYKGAKAKADRLFSEVIRSQGYCDAEGFRIPCSPQLQTMHIISRRYNGVRTDLRNAMAGCAAHHRFFTDHPREFSRFITESWAQDYYDLIFDKARPAAKVDWTERVEFLKDIKQRIESGSITLSEARELEN